MADHYSTLQKDFYRESGQWLSPFGIWAKCINPNLHFIYIFRKAQKFRKTPVLNIFWKLILRHYQIRYGFQIYPETEIGEGFYLGHWGSLVINPYTRIGKNCNMAQGVTIGQQNRGKNAGIPVIGNEVWIGANAVIVGGITIGDDVLIAPNAYVNFDVPPHSVVIGNPAKIIPADNATEGYINNKI
ncbi:MULTISPECIES: serine O-acetyltransferase [Chryseobacterium]|uniref:Serine O-acetyltransferase n=1 Tax=Chryseobacterium camelliae TaxID=1265445 RepID=A0ABU0TN96_9FLAO|nr:MULTISPECIES: serine acetyltransferase [Chryseobacterium]MDT3407633.1 serine O-acetyltransferase [Pseudacidovorax intermedius]MDQ1098513.1 serine O-acetyltransferase [Chryseobacterium camelliae]MDQ1102438.1 serine O-acetyltransferase [Chryseobacterium sp. SORGH_AS_1048]MDR6085872.1 serine O-acetyltransferase [Chryseobacterium sp. SORGH_AS_0909]MDR6130238.1 serine O-acetyltransferase [Chryseobacterium sp. SORGH_AS_1175]